jgi:hypothetical protein
MKRTCMIFLKKFVNFVCLCVRYIHDELIYTIYYPRANDSDGDGETGGL